MAKDANQASQIWNTREKIADAFVKEGIVRFSSVDLAPL